MSDEPTSIPVSGVPTVPSAAMDSAIQAFSSYTYDATQGLNLYETSKKLADTAENQLYGDYEQEFLDNDLAQFLVSHLIGSIMDFRFESESESDLKTVQDFFYVNDVMNDLQQMLMNALVFGTGFCQRFQVGSELNNFSRIDAATIEIEKQGMDNKGRLKYKYFQLEDTDDEEGGAGSRKPLRDNRLAVFKPIEVPNSSYGISMMRSSLLPLQAVRQLNLDIPAGIKRLAYETMVLKLDLEGVDPKEHKAKISQASASFVKYDSATSNVVAMDKRNELMYVGSGGGGQMRMIPILDLLEPILIFLLNKWFVPLGDVLQEKSNRALSQTQTETSRRRLRTLKQKFANFIEKELIQYILGGDEEIEEAPTVRVIHNVSFNDIKDEAEVLLSAVKEGILPREAWLKHVGIFLPDEDQTYLVPKNTQVVVVNPQEEPEVSLERANQQTPTDSDEQDTAETEPDDDADAEQ